MNQTEAQNGKRSRRRFIAIITCAVAAVVIIAGILVGINIHNRQVAEATAKAKVEKARIYKAEVLKRAYDTCAGSIDTEPALHDSLELEDGNKSLYLSSPDTAVQDYATYECVAVATDMPDSVMNKISQTTALAGMQSDEWANIEATWSYHSGDSLDITLELK
jgi:predicted TIM-barrel enzyme